MGTGELTLSEFDAADLAQRGISVDELARQVDLFRNPPPPANLVRGCSIGDGIEQLDDEDGCLAAHDRARGAGRLSKFVPASGAASRMFQALLALRGESATSEALERRAESGDGAAALFAQFVRGVGQLPFADDLRTAVRRVGDDLDDALRAGRLAPVVDAMVGENGLGYATLPKGLLPFHRYPNGSRTAFEEHLHEAVELVADDRGHARAHFTVSYEHIALFEAALQRVRKSLGTDGRITLDVAFSTQAPRSDTVAVDLDDRLIRDREGRIMFRPGGHGALLDNLASCGADVALIQNIDNIQPQQRRAASLRWKRLLIGRLVQLQERRRALCESGDHRGLRALCDVIGLDQATVPDEHLVAYCDRPLRVCGVVRNTGEPGGGPFWVRDRAGAVSRQIIESAQVDPRSEEQCEIFRGSTHFNPVLLACGLKSANGVPYDLDRFVDAGAVFLSRKSVDGVEVKALERPGLWNGSMAGWATVFAEIGDEAFTPVKTVVDLLRAEHRGGA